MTGQEAMELVLEANRGTLWPSPDGITLQEFIDHTIGRCRVFMPGTRTRISTFHAMSREYELIDPPRRTYFEISEIFRPADRIAFMAGKIAQEPFLPVPQAIAPNSTS
jgi:hypothetical protein